MNLNPPNFLTIETNIKLAYHQLAGKSPGIVFCCGYMSDMGGTKAMALENFCREHGQAFLRFDYAGHGQSSGKVVDGTISLWRQNALAVFDQLTAGPQILVGSSMGGWLALLVALARAERVAGLVGIAAAPDFTQDLIWDKLDAQQQQELLRDGVFYEKNPYSEEPYQITRELIADGRKHLLLRSAIVLDKPVRLLQGMLDEDVPWQRSLQLAEKITGNDVHVTLIKDGDHRLSRDQDLALLKNILHQIIIEN